MIKDLSFETVVDEKKIPATQFLDLVKGPLKTMSQLVNVVARVKALTEDVQARSLELQLQLTIESLKMCLDIIDDEQDEYRRIQFAIEQLQLITKPKYGRHYSPQIIVFAYMVYASSPAAYTSIRDENVLCLPSVSTLKKITRPPGEAYVNGEGRCSASMTNYYPLPHSQLLSD